jgi:hypothetical protein
VKGSFELGNEPSCSIKCWKLSGGNIIGGLSSSAQFQRMSELLV